MFKFLLVTFSVINVILCHEINYQLDEEEILLPIEALPPGTLVRARRQVFGGFSPQPGGGFNQQFGYRGSVFSTPTKDLSAWGSISQGGNSQGFRTPITYGAGTDFKSSSGHGLSASAFHIPKQGTQTTLSGNLNVLSTPNHNLNAFGSHTKTFDSNFHQIGKGSSTGGLGYQHGSGAALTASGTYTPGAPNTGTIAGSLPVFSSTDGRTNVNVNAATNLMAGQKPDHNVGISLSHNF